MWLSCVPIGLSTTEVPILKNENLLIVLSILVLAILLMNIFGGPKDPNLRTLKYSDFTYQVRSGNITTATIIGNTSIKGTFLDGNPYQLNIPPHNPGLIDLLRKYEVQIHYVPEPGTPWYVSLLIHWGPFIFIFVIWLLLMKRMQGPAGRLFSLGKSRAQRADPTKRRITFKDVAGVEESKEELVEIIDFFERSCEI